MLSRLRAIPGLQVTEAVPLARFTRFALGGPAVAIADASTESALIAAAQILREHQAPWTLIGGGTNLIAADEGFPGVVLRYTAPRIEVTGVSVFVEAGASLQELVDQTIAAGLQGLETMTGIPGWVGGAIYGNAGAYGHSINERVVSVRYFDGKSTHEIGNPECAFRYRESRFKQQKDWIILSAHLALELADRTGLEQTAAGIRKIRDEKYPPSMLCAGSIFKNLLLADLPEQVRAAIPERIVREGKVPSAYFLEQIGAKGMILGGIKVANYHANLLYNWGPGTAEHARNLIQTLKNRVQEAYGLILEEEVQYVGPLPEQKKIVP